MSGSGESCGKGELIWVVPFLNYDSTLPHTDTGFDSFVWVSEIYLQKGQCENIYVLSMILRYLKLFYLLRCLTSVH